MSKDMREQINNIKNFGQFLNENVDRNFIAYHISEYDFNQFDSTEHIGNYGTILDGSYFLNTKNGLDRFGIMGFIYTVKIRAKKIFTFNLRTDEHWYLTTEFQQLFSESLAGISNYLDDFFEEQNIDSVEEIDCIALTNLDYLDDKKTIEYTVLNDDIITIINKQKLD